MREHIKKRFREFIKDKVQWISCIIAVVLAINHTWQYVDSGYSINCIVRAVYCTLYIPLVLFFGRDLIPYLFLVFANVLIYLGSFNNYTSFIIVAIFCMIKKDKKERIAVLTLYVVNTLVLSQLHHKDTSHLLIHFVNCFCIYFALRFYVQIKQNIKPLILDNDQKAILKELANGKQQKEITLFSKNTITKKMKDAVITNQCITKDELLMKYIREFATI